MVVLVFLTYAAHFGICFAKDSATATPTFTMCSVLTTNYLVLLLIIM